MVRLASHFSLIFFQCYIVCERNTQWNWTRGIWPYVALQRFYYLCKLTSWTYVGWVLNKGCFFEILIWFLVMWHDQTSNLNSIWFNNRNCHKAALQKSGSRFRFPVNKPDKTKKKNPWNMRLKPWEKPHSNRLHKSLGMSIGQSLGLQ